MNHDAEQAAGANSRQPRCQRRRREIRCSRVSAALAVRRLWLSYSLGTSSFMDNAIYTIGAFIVPIVTNVIVLAYSCVGYRRTRGRVFVVWIAACALSLVGVFALYGLSGSRSSVEHHALWVFWSLDYIVAAILGTYGLVLLMHHVLSDVNTKPGA